jgi:hypothetical protein
MNRIIKTAAIAGIGAIGLIGTAAAASASVNVTNGVGTIGKGDVQTALGYANDAAFQADASKITFSNGVDTDTLIAHAKCGIYVNGVSTPDTFQNVDINSGTITTTRTPNVTVLKNNAGKVTGYTVNGVTTTTTGSQSYSAWATGCPAGMGFVGWADPANAFGHVVVNGGTDLTVSNGVKTVPLPNTPTV